MTAADFDAVVLAGGGARRLDGTDKALLRVGACALLDVALTAVAAAHDRIVVGPVRTVDTQDVLWLREDPPGGGPVAALAAALDVVTRPVVVALAADLPFVTADAVAILLAALDAGADGAVAVDDRGRRQPLLAAYRTPELRKAIPTQPDGARLRDTLDAMTVVDVALPGTPPPWWDCDTAEDLQRARDWAGAR